MILKELPERRTQLHAALRTAGGWTGAKPEKVALLDELMGTINMDGFPGAIVPRLLSGSMIYYVVTDTPAQWRNLQPLLRAFVGNTLTDFTGIPALLDAADSFEALLAQHSFPAVARFSAHGNPKLERYTVDALLMLLRSFGREFRERRAVPPAMAQVLYGFRMALASGDRTGADQAIDFLRNNLRLDALNLHFLEVQRDAEFAEWDKLYQRPFFDSLCQTRRSPRVTAALAEALYRARLLRFEQADDPTGALAFFRSVIQPQYGTLLTACPPSPRPAVAKLFVLAAVASSTPDLNLVKFLMDQAARWAPSEAAFVTRLAALVPPETLPAPEEAVPHSDDYARQLALAEKPEIEPTVSRARAILLAAVGKHSLEAYRIAVTYVKRLPPEDQQAVIGAPVFQGIWQEISQFAGDHGVPNNWREWAQTLPDLSFSEARAFAEQAVDEWPITDQLQSPEAVEALVTALQEAWGQAEDRLADSLPHLVTWVRNDFQWPNADFRALYDALLEMLLLSSNRSSAVLGAMVTLLDGRLSLGMEPKAYEALLTEMRTVARDSASIRTVDWLLDLCELTSVHPCPDQTARVAFWSVVAAYLSHFRTKMTRAQLALCADIAVTLGVPETFEGPTDSPDAAEERAVEGVLAVYTLAEGVGERAMRVLQPLYPNLRVELFHDQVSTPRLQQFARTADLFVICWTAAKHAATIDIRAKRPAMLPTIWAPGGGSSSVVRAVQEHLAGKPERKSA